jgi:hypothetical protein
MSSFPLTRSRAAAFRKQQERQSIKADEADDENIARNHNVNEFGTFCHKNSKEKLDDPLTSKRLKISQEEMSMNGAPEGELFGKSIGIDVISSSKPS